MSAFTATKRHLLSIYHTFASLCITLLRNPKLLPRLPGEIYNFYKAYRQFREKSAGNESVTPRPVFFQRHVESTFDAHYVIQGWWACSLIANLAPKKHIDLSSNVGFVAQLSAVVPVDFYEYNPPDLSLPGLSVNRANLLSLPFANGSFDSLSCLHVLEHIGLGRYGDPIDPLGMSRACLEISRVMTAGGNLFVSFPVGRERIEFNSQRVLDPEHVLSLFPDHHLVEFSIVNDKKKFVRNANLSDVKNYEYACGLYHFVKVSN
jgi:hypothetical protein